MENGPFMNDLPIKMGGSFHSYVSHYQRVPQELLQSNMFAEQVGTRNGW